MITLTTGVPGSGKSLYTISYIKVKAEKENRPVYYSGISDLKLPWIELDDATQWPQLPDGAIIVIDECQRVFRPRGNGSAVPEHVSALETHRHKGFDIFLITQHPMLVDNNVRRLIGQHFHVVRKFGLQGATVHEWGSTHEITQKNLMEAVKHKFPYTKEAFGYYKSAEVHTHKARIPARVFFLFILPFILVGLAVGGYFAFRNATDTKGRMAKVTGQQVAEGSVTGQPGVQKPKVLDRGEYIKERTPRIDGLLHTAPVYDEVTKVTEAPIPVGCVASDKGCRCIDQQGTDYATDEATCRHIVKHGMFVAWKKQDVATPVDSRQSVSSAPPVAVAPPSRERSFSMNPKPNWDS